MTVGAVGSSGTSLLVNGNAKLTGIVTTNNLLFLDCNTIVGQYEINNVSSGIINAGIGTGQQSIECWNTGWNNPYPDNGYDSV